MKSIGKNFNKHLYIVNSVVIVIINSENYDNKNVCDSKMNNGKRRCGPAVKEILISDRVRESSKIIRHFYLHFLLFEFINIDGTRPFDSDSVMYLYSCSSIYETA